MMSWHMNFDILILSYWSLENKFRLLDYFFTCNMSCSDIVNSRELIQPQELFCHKTVTEELPWIWLNFMENSQGRVLLFLLLFCLVLLAMYPLIKKPYQRSLRILAISTKSEDAWVKSRLYLCQFQYCLPLIAVARLYSASAWAISFRCLNCIEQKGQIHYHPK